MKNRAAIAAPGALMIGLVDVAMGAEQPFSS